MKPPFCQYDGAEGQLVDSAVVYHGRSYGMIWKCPTPGCDAYVGTHKGSKDHAPLGRMVNAAGREAKKKAHAAFDPLWKSGRMKRGDAYQALADFLGIPKARVHIGYFNPDECARVVEFANRQNGEGAAR